MIIWPLRFIVLTHRFLRHVWLIYIFFHFFSNLISFFFVIFQYFFRFFDFLRFFFFFERFVDFFLRSFYFMLHESSVLNGLFVIKFILSRFFFFFSRLVFFYSSYLFLIFTVLHKKFINERKEKSEEVHILFYLFFFKTYLKPSYRTKTEWYDRMIHDHSKMLRCLFFVMLITSIFFFNVRMVSMFPYGVCSPRDFNWFKVQKLGGLNKYVYRCCKDVWRNRFWKVGKTGLWSIFIDSVLSFLLTVENLFKL